MKWLQEPFESLTCDQKYNIIFLTKFFQLKPSIFVFVGGIDKTPICVFIYGYEFGFKMGFFHFGRKYAVLYFLFDADMVQNKDEYPNQVLWLVWGIALAVYSLQKLETDWKCQNNNVQKDF